jgi:UDP-3-O-[3-hydroxymyristoyl] N-acetylglucosamine deacetylase
MANSLKNPSFLDNSLSSLGLISKKPVLAQVISENPDLGINLICNGKQILAHHSNIFSTQRNTVLASADGFCICLTEHFLAACALLGVVNLNLKISEAELPFDDGSAFFWLEFLKSYAEPNFFNNRKKISQPIKIFDEQDSSRFIEMIPAENFSVQYNLDIKNPPISQSYTWSLGEDIIPFAKARTFSTKEENAMLGLDDWVLGYSAEGFSKDLHYTNELAAHKALDLIGDLMLSGVNPLSVDMKLISNKAGHALNARAAKALAEVFC